MDDNLISQFLDTPADADYGESDLIKMRKAFVNEKAAPEILDYKGDLVARLQDQIQNQEDTVANTDSTNAEGSLARAIWRLELARAKHVMRAYLRTRLHKLETCCAAVLADQSMQTRLSQRELQYAQDLFLESGKYMRDNILKDFPPEFRATTKQSNVSETYDMMTRPDMDKYVFMRVLEDRGAVELDADGEDVAELMKDDLYVVRYNPIKDLLRDDWVELI
ncbi:g7294 [Coccomyxa viridis]|uniref:DNA replication complex GINS protein SLD5 n=1 Tax=Coccomyxa viridis TaxID=1274662 RepID=A0ABP1G2C6_9CHLO